MKPLLNLFPTILKSQNKLWNLYYGNRYCGQIDLLELDIQTYHRYLKVQKIKPSELIECYLNRIAILDPYFHSIIQINANSSSEGLKYDNMDIDLVRYPLFGVPVILKDNIGTADLNTTAGSHQLYNSTPIYDSIVVQRLKNKGAIILAKSNLSQWSEFIGGMPNGYSEVGGQCVNPYVLSANPLGSSTGSAVSIALNLGLVALGTDTHGSIGGPAGRNGVVGFKPTAGLIPRLGVIPFSLSHDSIGPITRNIKDALILLNSLAGPSDDYLAEVPSLLNDYKVVDYLAIEKNIEGMRIAVDKLVVDEFDYETKQMTLDLLNVLEQNGAILVEFSEPIAEKNEKMEYYHTYMDKIEFKFGINNYLNSTIGGPKSLDEITKGSLIDKERAKFESLSSIPSIAGDLYQALYQENMNYYGKQGIDRILAKYQADVIITLFGRPSNKLGYPVLTFPMLKDHNGIPIKGPAFTATALQESNLLKVGLLLDQYYPRPLPTFKKCCSSYDVKNKNEH